ncbi:MAG: helix-turn-helix domain-containing protein [Kiritimatiellia bacterium]
MVVCGVEMFLYNPDDKLAMRMAWVQVCENGFALRYQVANALGIGLRSLQYWIKRYREEGMAGLVDRPKSGAPRKVTGMIEKRILRLRAEKATVREIAAKCLISVGAVHNILAKQLENSVHQQMELTDLEQASIEECDDAPLAEDVLSVSPVAETPPILDLPEGADVSAIKEEGTTQLQRQMSTCELSDEAEALMANDRWLDRFMARMGKLDDASALFSPGENVPWAGVMMAAVILSHSPFLGLAQKVYGGIGPAFYGLRTVMMTYVTMALLRICRIEDVRRDEPQKLGRVLGLDRVAEVRTLRRKWHKLCRAGKALELMEAVGRSRVEQLDQPPDVIMVDGHLGIYTGKRKIGQVFSTRENQVVKGYTDNWIHLPGGAPLLILSCSFNEGLSQGLPEAITKSRAIIGGDPLTCVFDRGGWSTELWEEIIKGGNHVMSYRKGSFDPWELELFVPGPIKINGKDHAFIPFMRDVEIPVYEKEISHKGSKVKYRKTARVLKLKEVRILRADNGQTSILTSRMDLPAEQIVSLQLARWGDQENQFKYMMREFDLDALWMYGTDPIDEDVDHPHPDYARLQARLRKLVDQRKKFLNRIWSALPDATQAENEEQMNERISQWLRSTDPKKLVKLNTIETSIDRTRETLEQTPERQSVTASGFVQLKPESRRLCNVIKTVACEVEGALAEMIVSHYQNAENEKRRLIAAALTTSGSLRLEPGALVVRLNPQSSPVRTRAVDAVCRQLNDYKACFPGSSRIIRFETER